MKLEIANLIDLGQYAIKTIEDTKNEIDIRAEILNDLKRELTTTKRFMGDVPQDDPDLNKILSYFNRHKEIVDEVVKKPHLKMDIEFTIRFIASNQQRINEILKN